MPPWIISRQGSNESYEFFANVFASHLLVPSTGLDELINVAGWQNDSDPSKAIILAHTFRVSYAFMLLRLEKDGHIKPEQKQTWQEFSPSALAHRTGLDASFFQSQEHNDPDIKRYPPSVLRKVKQFIDRGELTESQVVDLLGIDLMTVRQEFLAEKPCKSQGCRTSGSI